MSWLDRHGWVPLLRGTDGLTGRQRRLMAARYVARMRLDSPRGALAGCLCHHLAVHPRCPLHGFVAD